MKYLLDTHTLIWSILDSNKLSAKVRNIIEDSKNEIFVSGITFWEIAIKIGLGKLSFGNLNSFLIPNICNDYGFTTYAPEPYDFITYSELPQVENHRDPFDRMLIHSAIKNNFVVLSCDSKFKNYEKFGLQLLW